MKQNFIFTSGLKEPFPLKETDRRYMIQSEFKDAIKDVKEDLEKRKIKTRGYDLRQNQKRANTRFNFWLVITLITSALIYAILYCI